MLENLNLVTMLVALVVVGALFAVTRYVSSREGREPTPATHRNVRYSGQCSKLRSLKTIDHSEPFSAPHRTP